MDDVKIFKEFLARVTESANKPNDGHKQQLVRSSNKLIDMYVQAKQEIKRLEQQMENVIYTDTDYKPKPHRTFKID